MRAYISRHIQESDEDMERAESTIELLEQVGFDIVNPQETSGDRIERLCGCIRALDGCEVVFMMSGWRSSWQAQHEYDYAVREGKIILFEESFRFVDRVKDAILKVMGLPFETYATRSRLQGSCYARMIFVHHCRADKMRLTAIAKLVGRDHSTILHYLNRYDDDMKYNAIFREYAERVNEILNGN